MSIIVIFSIDVVVFIFYQRHQCYCLSWFSV